MKRTFGLLGMFLVGLVMLFNPRTGIITTNGIEAVGALAATPSSITTTAPPPTEDDVAAAGTAPATTAPAVTTTTTGAPAPSNPTTTTTATATTSTTEPVLPATISVVGPAIDTEWGFFQVEAIVSDGVLVDIVTLREPTDRKSRRINQQAIPVYEAAALDIQSAEIDVLSGATVTWQGYTTSLQAALDEAGI